MPPGAATLSIRAAILTPSPKISSSSMMMSPTLMPMRNWIGSVSEPPVSCSRTCCWISIAQATASTALPNYTNTPSPISLTIRPAWAAIAGSMRPRRNVFRRFSVPISSIPMRRE